MCKYTCTQVSQISTFLSAHCQYSKLSLKQKVTIPVTKLSLAAAIPWKPHSHLGPEQDHLATFEAPHFMQRSRRRKFLTCLVFPLCCKTESWIDDIAWPCHTLLLRNKRCLVICNLTSDVYEVLPLQELFFECVNIGSIVATQLPPNFWQKYRLIFMLFHSALSGAFAWNASSSSVPSEFRKVSCCCCSKINGAKSGWRSFAAPMTFAS